MIGLAAALAAPAALAAQDRPIGFGISGGLSMPTGDGSDNVETGYVVAGHVFFKPAAIQVLRFRGDVSYDRWAAKGVDGNVSVLGFAGNAIFDIGSSSAVKPYVLGGIGYYNSKATLSSTVGDVSVSNGDMGFQVGGGLNFQLSGFSTFLEAKYAKTFGGDSDSNGAWIPITFGIRF
jgi:opacity protein-like surface antigen